MTATPPGSAPPGMTPGGGLLVPDSALLSVLTGSGVAGVFCVLFICGLIFPRSVVEDLKTENRDLKAAREADRASVSAAVAAAVTTRDILADIHQNRENRDITTGNGR